MVMMCASGKQLLGGRHVHEAKLKSSKTEPMDMIFQKPELGFYTADVTASNIVAVHDLRASCMAPWLDL